jgi:uncharacterized LabA/DUF88 family protein
MARLVFFFDGFNVYHSLKHVPGYNKYKWLDLNTLSRFFITKKDVITKVYYFTAYATWLPDSMKRHKIYVKALEDSGVKVVLGEFKNKDKFCQLCKRWFRTKEEKQTDVNIASYLFREAFLDRYDKAILVTVDNDLVPAIGLVKKTFPGKEIILLTPIQRYSYSLQRICDFRMKIKEKHLIASQFPDVIPLGDGKELRRPSEWA